MSGMSDEEKRRAQLEAQRDIAARGGPRTSHINIEGHTVQAEGMHDSHTHKGDQVAPADTWVNDPNIAKDDTKGPRR